MTMYPARVTELPNPAMLPPAVRLRAPGEEAPPRPAPPRSGADQRDGTPGEEPAAGS